MKKLLAFFVVLALLSCTVLATASCGGDSGPNLEEETTVANAFTLMEENLRATASGTLTLAVTMELTVKTGSVSNKTNFEFPTTVVFQQVGEEYYLDITVAIPEDLASMTESEAGEIRILYLGDYMYVSVEENVFQKITFEDEDSFGDVYITMVDQINGLIDGIAEIDQSDWILSKEGRDYVLEVETDYADRVEELREDAVAVLDMTVEEAIRTYLLTEEGEGTVTERLISYLTDTTVEDLIASVEERYPDLAIADLADATGMTFLGTTFGDMRARYGQISLLEYLVRAGAEDPTAPVSGADLDALAEEIREGLESEMNTVIGDIVVSEEEIVDPFGNVIGTTTLTLRDQFADLTNLTVYKAGTETVIYLTVEGDPVEGESVIQFGVRTASGTVIGGVTTSTHLRVGISWILTAEAVTVALPEGATVENAN